MGASGNPPFTTAFVGAPCQWGFARHGRGLRRVRGGSCAPNAMPPFRVSLEASHHAPLSPLDSGRRTRRLAAPSGASLRSRLPSASLRRISGSGGFLRGAASACGAVCRRPARSEYFPSPDRRHLACLRPRLPPSPPPPRAVAPPARSAHHWHGERVKGELSAQLKAIRDTPRKKSIFQRFRGVAIASPRNYEPTRSLCSL